jgi:hypothetical protein
MRRFTRKRFLGALSVIAVLAAAGAAIAYFTSSGSGTGTASVGNSSNFIVSDTSTPVTLYPGTGSFGIAGTINNPGSANQGLGTLTVTINAPTGMTNPGDASHPCSASDFALTGTGGSGWVVAAGGDSATYTYSSGNELNHGATVGFPAGLSVSMVDHNYDQDNCQGATVNWTDSAQS